MRYDEEPAQVSIIVDKFSPCCLPCAQIFPRINDRVGAERAAAERVDAE